MKHPWVVKENKAGNGVDTPRFFIDYGGKAAGNRAISYQIISLLKRDADLIVKVDSSLLNLPAKQRDGMVRDLITELKSLGLEYRYRKFLGSASPNLWNQLLPFRKNEEYHHEVIIDLPDGVWRQQSSTGSAFMRTLGYGTFYYICKDSGRGPGIVDDFFNGGISPEEQSDYFVLSVFDWTYFGQMGLFTGSLTLADCKQLLKIQ
jgi:hypothetical protein